MRRAVIKKSFIAQVTIILVVAFLTLSMTNAQTTSFYGTHSGYNPTAFTLTMYSPNNQTANNNSMLLKFNITWTTYSQYYFSFGPPLNGYYAYCVDNNPFVSISSNQSASDYFFHSPVNNFTVNPSFSYLVDVSNLTNGYHKIAIKASLYVDGSLHYHETSLPTLFLIQNSSVSPTPYSASCTLISTLTIIVIVTVVVLVAAIASLLLYRKHRITSE